MGGWTAAPLGSEPSNSPAHPPRKAPVDRNAKRRSLFGAHAPLHPCAKSSGAVAIDNGSPTARFRVGDRRTPMDVGSFRGGRTYPSTRRFPTSAQAKKPVRLGWGDGTNCRDSLGFATSRPFTIGPDRASAGRDIATSLATRHIITPRQMRRQVPAKKIQSGIAISRPAPFLDDHWS